MPYGQSSQKSAGDQTQNVVVAIVAGLLVLFVLVYVVKWTYNNSIVRMSGNTLPEVDATTSFIFIIFAAITGAIFTGPMSNKIQSALM
jgi:hypothetical protein